MLVTTNQEYAVPKEVLSLCLSAQGLSQSKKCKVGVVVYPIEDPTRAIRGWNYLPGRIAPLEDAEGTTNPRVTHAEIAAINNYLHGYDVNGSMICVTTRRPCKACQEALADFGVVHIHVIKGNCEMSQKHVDKKEEAQAKPVMAIFTAPKAGLWDLNGSKCHLNKGEEFEYSPELKWTYIEPEEQKTGEDILDSEALHQPMLEAITAFDPTTDTMTITKSGKWCIRGVTKYYAEGDVISTKETFMKDDGKKIRYELIEPSFTKELAKVITFGATKYEAHNWKKCEDPDRYIGALLRHIEEYRAGEIIDPETKLKHLAHAACNLMFLMHFDGDITDAASAFELNQGPG